MVVDRRNHCGGSCPSTGCLHANASRVYPYGLWPYMLARFDAIMRDHRSFYSAVTARPDLLDPCPPPGEL